MMLFEYPFNERVRTYLRIEHLFARMFHMMKLEAATEHHFAVESMFEIMDVCARADLKMEVLKDLERQRIMLSSFRGNPAIAEAALDAAIAELERCFQALSQTPGKAGQALQDNDWLMAIRSRVSIPGGTCSFDLPAYYAWLQESHSVRQQHLSAWLAHLMPMHHAVVGLLGLLRDSSEAQKMMAMGGAFQQHLPQGKTFQLLRLSIDPALGIVPEISANRLLVSIRFVHAQVNQRSAPATSDVAFDLALSC
jgi:cell division protein ZapD